MATEIVYQEEQNKSETSKLTYEAPLVVEYGSITNLTRSGEGGNPDSPPPNVTYTTMDT